MAVPKKCTSMVKKRIRRNIWRKKGYFKSLIFSFSISKNGGIQ